MSEKNLKEFLTLEDLKNWLGLKKDIFRKAIFFKEIKHITKNNIKYFKREDILEWLKYSNTEEALLKRNKRWSEFKKNKK